MWKILVCLALFPILAWSKEVVITEAESGTTVVIAPSDTLVVRLKGNPTTGYEWEDVSDLSNILEKKEVSYTPDSNLCGSGGEYLFQYQPKLNGEVNLHLQYRRIWETVPPIQEYAVTIIVHALQETKNI